MEFRPTSDEERAWWRIVACLLAFGRLAEQAAYRSVPVRWLVLSILNLAEILVADLVLDVAGLPLPDPSDISLAGHAPEDALALAARFMALAAMLAGMIRETHWSERWPAPRRHSSKPWPLRLPAGWTRPPHDTS